MAQKWRSLTHQQRGTYEKRASEKHEAPLEVMSLMERNNTMLHMTKRHQVDVSVTCKMPVLKSSRLVFFPFVAGKHSTAVRI